ncbi:hypothetical protein SAMN05660477_00147 [Soonwooa buanensis]|uniref:Uncharacterized protein n=1 Tax=Soonwooa buanensis TaxID=619805 RepID=A0A1T5CLC8_9FLAO|nr:hypothetical protein [Soonwooa buanensis]SKB60141.1 hypothetical protein SAMN05660477_00147 [Soonwooa buanensis]
MKTLKANIPSIKTFTVNENGEIFNYLGKKLNGKKNPSFPYLRSLDFLNLDKKRQVMTFGKIVWNTFYPENMAQADEIVQVIDREAEHVFALKNLRKITKTEKVKELNEIRFSKLKSKRDNKNA